MLTPSVYDPRSKCAFPFNQGWYSHEWSPIQHLQGSQSISILIPFFFFLSEAHKKIERWQPTHFRCFRMMSSPSSITSHMTWSGDHLYYIVVLLFTPLKVEVKTYTCVPGIGCRLVLISIKGASKCKEERSLLLNQPSWIKDEVQPTCPHHTTHMETCGWGHSLSFIQLGWSGVTAILSSLHNAF